MTDGIRATVQAAITDTDKFIKAPRIYEDLAVVAAAVLQPIRRAGTRLGPRAASPPKNRASVGDGVTRIEFEHPPGRGNPRYTADHSAFDVYVEHVSQDGSAGFLASKSNTSRT